MHAFAQQVPWCFSQKEMRSVAAYLGANYVCGT